MVYFLNFDCLGGVSGVTFWLASNICNSLATALRDTVGAPLIDSFSLRRFILPHCKFYELEHI